MINETNPENGVNGTQTYGEGFARRGNWGTAASTKPSTNYYTEEG